MREAYERGRRANALEEWTLPDRLDETLIGVREALTCSGA
jgi:hypothetical protein